ncbi:diguanylate cyclase [Noviherbaspirillum sp.]|jgi:diguanylate cyclase (GGDEF)-like protein/PAS domain S-box-containing protein|uniref:diguanylate cyclase n=1 Tax=Noviherbaspirillum sp. TaxID=1926288 RepID=UPI0025D7AE1A|nr:diguanylate cyclase [Noviherbaspirillum sp.]
MQTRTKSTPLFAHWLILSAALLVLGAAGVFYFLQGQHRTQQRETERLLAQSRVIQENVSQNLLAVNQTLLDVRTRISALRAAQEFDFYLKTLTDAMPAIRTLIVLDAQGDVTGASRAELKGRNFSQREYFQEALRNPDPEMLFVSPPFETSLGVYSVTLTKALLDARENFAGVVTATLDPNYFAPLLESIRYTPDTMTSIVHWNGTRFLVRPDQGRAPAINLLQPGTFFYRHRESARETSVFSGKVYASGEERMIAQRTIMPAGLKMDQPLVVAVSRKLDRIYATVYRDIEILAAIYALISMLSIAGLYAYQREHRESAAREAEAFRMVEESERFMKMIADHLPGMVAYWNNELRCRFSNAAYLEWFGKTPEQMRNIRIQDLMGPELFAKNEPYMRAALRGEPQLFERTLTKPDGSVGYTWAQYIPDKEGDTVKGFVVLVSDVTKLKQVEFALAESESKLKTIIETEPECVTLLSLDGTVQQMNRAGLDMIGVDAEEQIAGSRLCDMAVPQYQSALRELNTSVVSGERGRLAFELVGRKGTHRWLEAHAVPMRDKDGSINGSLWVIRDISDRKKAEQELERLAQTDFLTGLANRRQFLLLAGQELSHAARYGGPLSVLMMDIDHFKKINDTYGHKCGDIVLQTFATLFHDTMRTVDITGRLGGEEFAAVLPQTDGEHALEVATRLLEIVSAAEVRLEDGRSIRFTVSIGLASRVDTIDSMDTLLACADAALYEAKNTGRNKVCVYQKT